MSDKKYVVPDGMYKAAIYYQDSGIQCSAALEAAMGWLAENPVIPSEEWVKNLLLGAHPELTKVTIISSIIAQWQREMFLSSEEIPKEIKDLLFDNDYRPTVTKGVNERIEEAFRRGKAAK